MIGPYSQIAGGTWAPDDGQWQFYELVARASGIRAGTTEILKNILGERVLGLPREPDPYRDVPWRDVPRS